MQPSNTRTTRIAIAGAVAIVLASLLSIIWMGNTARKEGQEAVHNVSSLYLGELAGRREQVVASNLARHVEDMKVAIDLMGEEDLASTESLQAYQARMKKFYKLEKFAFVDTAGRIYTSKGMQNNIEDYDFDYRNLTEPEIFILNPSSRDKKVIIAVPVDLAYMGNRLVASFEEIDMDVMLEGVSMEAQESDATFCNIYTKDGIALSDTVLGGLAVEDNLLDALKKANYDEGSSYEEVESDFAEGKGGEVSFEYNGIRETLSYVPVKGTDWLLTYLVRESVISDQIGAMFDGIVNRGILQSVIMAVALTALFAFIILQNRKNARILLEKETSEAENRARHQELEQRLALQEKLLEQERHREQQTQMITALSSDYWSVYYVELDNNEGLCYQSHADLDGKGFKAGERFPYLEAVTAYANQYVVDENRDEFLSFVQPDAIRAGLAESRVISYRYRVFRHNRESYEMIRFAGVRHPEDREDHAVHAVGGCFIDVDAETRKDLAQTQALSDALQAAEQANKAKTAFLSNMSHEIRTPMNAIIGLDNIALANPDLDPQTREYLEKIGASADHLLNLINDILDMSRIESGRLVLRNEEFSFPKLLDTINTMFSSQCQERGLDYQCHIQGEVDDYYIGDNMKLRQVLINILGNAVKFTNKGGSVSLDVKRTAHFDRQTTLRFTVSDTGVGMSEEFLPHIFDTFSQEDASAANKYGSSGLGLAITKSIVEMMNGDIKVTSKKGEGSTFVITVTLADAEHVAKEDDSVLVRPDQMTVLVIDDDRIACEHAQLVLEKAGIACDLAESGDPALEMVRLRHARREPYNLILVDWQMPVMDGVETTRRIREEVGHESAIIILTAYNWDDVLEEGMEAGVDCFISKPVFAATIIEEFKAALKRRNITSLGETHKAELEGRRVLLAEDMKINSDIMIMVLGMRGIEADLAENGLIAVQKFSEHEPGYYDAILMDMLMPEMDGLEATRAIRAMDHEDATTIPIIALTANAFDEDVQRSLQAGLNAHLSKPVQPETLFETLETLIRD